MFNIKLLPSAIAAIAVASTWGGAGQTASADATGTNKCVRVAVTGDAKSYTVSGRFEGATITWGPGSCDNVNITEIHVYGPGNADARGSKANGASANGSGSGKACAEAWGTHAGKPKLHGRACVDVK